MTWSDGMDAAALYAGSLVRHISYLPSRIMAPSQWLAIQVYSALGLAICGL